MAVVSNYHKTIFQIHGEEALQNFVSEANKSENVFIILLHNSNDIISIIT